MNERKSVGLVTERGRESAHVIAHLGGEGGKKASLEPSLYEEHPWQQKRQPTTLLVTQCVFGQPHSSFKRPIFLANERTAENAEGSEGEDV